MPIRLGFPQPNGRWISSERAYVTPDNDWTEHAPEVEAIEVPGDHDSMVLEPNVRVLAARMRRVIEAGDVRGRSQMGSPAWPIERAAQ